MQTFLLAIFSLVLVVALIAWYMRVYRRQAPLRDDTSSYLKRESVLQSHEQQCFRTLLQAVGQHASVFPKVRLSDLVEPQSVQPQRREHWQRIQRRCVDFVLCSPNDLAPVLVIDLDTRAKQRRRSQSPGGDVVDNTLKSADIPLLRIRAAREYDAQDVLHQIRLALASSREPIQEVFKEPPKKENPVAPWRRLVADQLAALGRWTSQLRHARRRA